MNYLQLIIQFWKLRRSKRITSLQADLYFYLIQECNERDWENPFECANKLICGSIGISEPSLIDARNRLQQLGLIEFKSGKRNESSPIYSIINLTSNLKNLSRKQVNTLVEPLVETEKKAPPIKEQTKHKPKPKQNSNSHSSPDGDVEKTKHWKKLVEVWFVFYKEKFSVDPTFNGSSSKSLKSIVETIEKVAIKGGKEWTEDFATAGFKHFLMLAYSDDWLRQNFLLTNLYSKFDSIVQKINNGNSQNGKTQTGAGVSTSSAFSKIDSMFGQNGGASN